MIKMEKYTNFIERKLKESNSVKPTRKKASRKEVEYDNILEGVDIEYQTLPTKAKETIVLKDDSKDNLPLS